MGKILVVWREYMYIYTYIDRNVVSLECGLVSTPLGSEEKCLKIFDTLMDYVMSTKIFFKSMLGREEG